MFTTIKRVWANNPASIPVKTIGLVVALPEILWLAIKVVAHKLS